jgi:predicted ABC-type ATPase
MSGPPIFHLLAGPNGAGKSTLYRAFVAENVLSEDLPFINADIYERENLAAIDSLEERSEAARTWADSERARLLANRISFVSETVFSHSSKLTLIQDALASGFLVVLYIIAVENPKLLLKRVAQRVKEGGHSVPEARILSRYPRTLDNLRSAIRIASVSYIYDSSSINITAQAELKLVAIYQPHRISDPLRFFADPVPDWVRTMTTATTKFKSRRHS